MKPNTRKSGFSLAELLVVVSIIALLIAIALPSFTRARQAAKSAATKSTIVALGNGLQAFRAEQALSSVYPPSSSDDPNGVIDNPYGGGDSPVPITGASLLVYALAGPDQRGTAGFSNPSGQWSAITGGPGSGEMYDPSISVPRYGPYVDGKLLENTRPMRGVDFEGNPVGLMDIGVVRRTSMPEAGWGQRFFVDDFDQPILYYRARRVATNMITNPSSARVGVYDHRDNAWLTGGPVTHSGGGAGRGTLMEGGEHAISNVRYDDAGDACFGSTANGCPPAFDSFIIDPHSVVMAGNTVVSAKPVNPDTYLLISPGPDGRYGTPDDVKNWGK